ncbi:putative phosphohydrolase [Rhizobium leguminosarum bv. trifolii WSM597]|uniref:Putative phosphohydrolase n=1 Tax=Rhizobium leguminosarum bv. trifolii WSM597 TaxID=754764 RepID=J0HCU3_RHILT|nr:metallophosphoesterase [Rhizobium leguminosarum]EJB02271.1 putative phosphohydrolase [Rhizobium leguminosarum bv. trifolii WSM597]EJB08258.1 putative phosphohydrolase [Rhizobium leguminosarum bv. trifolii WSM597]
MYVNILVVDDEAGDGSDRRKKYEDVGRAMNSVAATYQFNLIFAQSGIHAWDALRQKSVDFIFLDLVLSDSWLSGISFEKLLGTIDETVPFAIITSKFDVSNMRELSAAISRPGCKSFLKWIDLNDPREVAPYLHILVSETARQLRSLDTSVALDPDESAFILHLSDIQYGGFSVDSQPLEMQAVTQKVKALCRGHNPTFVALTGDFAETGAPAQFDGCYEWIVQLLGRLGFRTFPSSRVLVVPGNHDVNLPLSSAGNLHYEGGKIEISDAIHDARLNQLGLFHYSEFFRKISSLHQSLDSAFTTEQRLGWISDAFLHLGIVFYGLNTTTPLVPRGLPMRKVLNNELGDLARKLNSIGATWQAEGRPDEPFVIGLSHHCLTGDAEDRSVENPKATMQFIASNTTHLFLHGHVHESDTETRSIGGKKAYVRSCASTISKPAKARPEDSNRGFNLIELERRGGIVTGMRIDMIDWRGADLVEKTRRYERGHHGFHITDLATS